MQETERDLGLIPRSGRSPEEGMATHSSILAWEIPWMEEPGGLQSIRLQRVRHDWSALACAHATLPLYTLHRYRCMHTNMSTHTYTPMQTYMYIHTHAHEYHVPLCTCRYACTCHRQHMPMYAYTHVCVVHVHADAFILMCMNTHAHTDLSSLPLQPKLFVPFLNCVYIEVYLTYCNLVLFSSVQQSDSFIHIFIIFQMFFSI